MLKSVTRYKMTPKQGIEPRIIPLSVSLSDVRICIMHYYTRCLKSKVKSAFIIRVFKPGARRPGAGARLVSLYCFCADVCVCVSAPKAINN